MNQDVSKLISEVIARIQENKLEKNDPILLKAIKEGSESIAHLYQLGIACAENNRVDDAILLFEAIQPSVSNDSRILYNLGVLYASLNDYEIALQYFDKALDISKDDVEIVINKASTLHELERYQEALVYHDKALDLDSSYAQAWSNKGNTLNNIKEYDQALACYDKALAISVDYAEAWANKGITLGELGRLKEAILHYDKALSLRSDLPEAWLNKGAALYELKQYDLAISHYKQALQVMSDIKWLGGDLLHTQMKVCSWTQFDQQLTNAFNGVLQGKKVIQPFALLALSDDPFLLQQSALIYTKDRYPKNLLLGEIKHRPSKNKIRIGYLSADFHNHATGYLMAELFELHDKSQFEFFAFSFGPILNDETRQRLIKSFDQFIEVGHKSDIEVAQLCRDFDLDIAVDLKGFTDDSRPGIFSYRAAPIQVNYLGYPGTMGADYMDYIIADKVLIPPDAQKFYSEKVAYLSDTYQPNDRKRLISERQFTRQELGLPEKGFVFCCFNNNYKILPEMFDAWMRILKRVEGSVLWLFQDNARARENLLNEAKKRGVDSARLVFAERMPLAEHLARHRQADLFLDTFPYNAHTTTSDALWAGLPVLTMMGKSFPSRVSASLLTAMNLPRLITNSLAEFEGLAIELATNPKTLEAIRRTLVSNRLTSALFDAPLYTKHLEAAYLKMYERYQDKLPVDHIVIP